MKKYIAFILALALFAPPAHAITVTCTNCSTNFMQALDRVTNVEQLSSLMKQYQEAVEQKRQQIRMVQQNIEQYENMLQNTAKLPSNLVNEMKNSLTRLASLSSTLKTQRGDIVALGEIFTTLFPEQSLFGDLAGASPQQTAAANARYQAEWDKWAKSVDQASQATFQLSALQVQEARQLRELMATQVQSSLASQMKQEKESQMAEEAWRETLKTNRIGKAQAKPDPF